MSASRGQNTPIQRQAYRPWISLKKLSSNRISACERTSIAQAMRRRANRAMLGANEPPRCAGQNGRVKPRWTTRRLQSGQLFLPLAFSAQTRCFCRDLIGHVAIWRMGRGPSPGRRASESARRRSPWRALVAGLKWPPRVHFVRCYRYCSLASFLLVSTEILFPCCLA